MESNERAIESGEATQRALGEAAIAAIRNQLTAPGELDCTDCGTEIPAARRAALPSATRCIHCQQRSEQARR